MSNYFETIAAIKTVLNDIISLKKGYKYGLSVEPGRVTELNKALGLDINRAKDDLFLYNIQLLLVFAFKLYHDTIQLDYVWQQGSRSRKMTAGEVYSFIQETVTALIDEYIKDGKFVKPAFTLLEKPKRCSICNHTERKSIESDIMTESFRTVARKYNVSKDAIDRHITSHYEKNPKHLSLSDFRKEVKELEEFEKYNREKKI